MFKNTAIIFFIAFFTRNLCGSLNPIITKQDNNCLNKTQTDLNKIGDQLVALREIWNAVVLKSFQEKLNWEEAQQSVLKIAIEEKIQRLEHQQDELLEQNDCSPEKWFVPDNFKRIGSRLFYISTKVTLDWFSAGNACQEMGGKLATIQNKDELKLIVSKLKWNSGYWLDLNDLSKEGEFVSSNSGKPASFLNWRKGQPDNYNNNEHCVQLINNYIYDCSCSDKRRFICEA